MVTSNTGEAIFLSASVPDPKRSPKYAATADTVSITAAVSAVVYRMLIWGGHPAITPMIWVVAQDVGVDYASWVRLYQSRYFEDEFPEDNEKFRNVVYTEDVGRDREKSLLKMREQMFAESSFKAAVFIGGMGGIIDEFELFRCFSPDGLIVPVVSTGGATVEVASRVGLDRGDLADDLDYVALFHRHLDISVRENRYRSSKEQPKAIEDQLWRHS